jgi:hypothetical protein
MIRVAKFKEPADLVERLRVRHWYRVPVHLDALVVGALGSWDRDNEALLPRLRIHKGRLTKLRRQMVLAAIKWT